MLVRTLFDCLEGGDSLDEFLSEYPTVNRKQAIQVLELMKETLLADAR